MVEKDEPPRKVVVGTSMYAMWGTYPGLEKRLEALGEIVDEMASKVAEIHPGAALDLAVLPEDAVCGGREGPAAERSVPLEGPVLDTMGAKARQHMTYLVLPMFMVEDEEQGVYSNAAVLLDRNGEVAGIYRKVHPVAAKTGSVLEGGVMPGKDFPVFECDFGRLGIQICFDMAYDDGWEALARKGAELVVWPSQSPQTVRPAARALHHRVYLVSSTWRNNASIFEPTGMMAAQIREPVGQRVREMGLEETHEAAERVLVRQIDLSYVLLPWQPELRNGEAMTEKYGDRVGYHYSEAEDRGIFWSNDPETPIGQMVREMGLEEIHESVARNRKLQEAVRGGSPSLR